MIINLRRAAAFAAVAVLALLPLAGSAAGATPPLPHPVRFRWC